MAEPWPTCLVGDSRARTFVDVANAFSVLYMSFLFLGAC